MTDSLFKRFQLQNSDGRNSFRRNQNCEMSKLSIILILFFSSTIIEACDTRTCGLPWTCWNGRKKREVTNQVQDILLEFDIRLTEDLAKEIKDMSEGDKQQFIKDLEKMNNAVRLQITNAKQSERGPIQITDEFVNTISDKVARDFQGKNWFNRLRAIAGDQIAKLLQEVTSGN